MNWQRAVTLDRVPVLTLILFLLVSWASTVYFLDHSVVTIPSPFTPVWGAYDHEDAARLVSWAIAGLILALLVPLPGATVSWRSLIHTVGAQVRSLSWLWLLVTFGTLALMILTKGHYLLEAPRYLEFVAPAPLVSAVSVVQPAAVLAAGFLSVKHPTLARVAMVLWLVVLFACATRVFAGVILLYMVGKFLAGGKMSWLGWLGTAIITVILLPIPLYCRELNMHGLIPYAHAMEKILQDPAFFGKSLVTTTSSFGFSVPLLIFVSRQQGITASDMLISLNPGPGSMVGWYDILFHMRVHEFIPYSALGEWASFGGFVLLLFTLVWALVVRICLKSVASNPHPTMVLFLSAVLGMSLLMVVMITQYNTRAVSRIVSMMILVTVLDRLVRPWTARYLERRSARLARWHRADGVREDAVIDAG